MAPTIPRRMRSALTTLALLMGIGLSSPVTASVEDEIAAADEIVRKAVVELDSTRNPQEKVVLLGEAVEAIGVLEQMASGGLAGGEARKVLQALAAQAVLPDVLRLSLVGAWGERIKPGEAGLEPDLQAKSVLEKIGDPAYRSAAWSELARAHLAIGQSEEAERLAVRAIEDAKGIDRRETHDGALRAAILVFKSDATPEPVLDIATNAMSTASARAEIYHLVARASWPNGEIPSQAELFDLAKGALARMDYAKALIATQALYRDDERRSQLLLDLMRSVIAEGNEVLAIKVAKSIVRNRDQNEALELLIDARLDRGKTLRAKEIVPLLLTARAKVEADISIARKLHKQGYHKAARDLLTSENLDSAREPFAASRLVAAMSDFDMFDEAKRMATGIAVEEARSFAYSRLAKRLADDGRLDAAEAAITEVSLSDDRAHARAGIAKAYAKKGDLTTARTMLADISVGKLRDGVLEEIAKDRVDAGKLDEARLVLEGTETRASRCRILIKIALASTKVSTQAATAVLAEAVSALQGDMGGPEIAEVAVAYARIGDLEQADRLINTIADKDLREEALKKVADILVEKGNVEDTQQWLPKLAVADHAEIVAKLAERDYRTGGDVEKLVSAVQDLPFSVRIAALRRMSEQRARALDKPGWFTNPGSDPLATVGDPVSSQKANFVVGRQSVQAPAPPTRRLDGLSMPDIFSLDANNMRSRVPAPAGGVGHLAILGFSPFSLEAFKLTSGGTSAIHQVQISQQLTWPRYIAVEKGVVTLGSLIRDVPEIQGLNLLIAKGDTLLVRVPIIVLPGATLLMSGVEFSQYRLGAQSGAFLAVAGKLIVQDAEIIGFDEVAGKPKVADEHSKSVFRPFITAWGGSDLQIAGSRLAMLGYDSSKAFGLTQSSGAAVQSLYAVDENRPVGNIIDNSFENLRYGYYSYEADSVRLIGNEYRDNVVYGIDPHDRSHGLVIALNTSYGAHKKHGIIVSREVDDSFIVGNVSLWNKGSGIMLDRTSRRNIIYANTAIANKGDGLTFYESGCNVAASNEFSFNLRAGIKVRNSVDVGLYDNLIDGNKGSGADIYVAELSQSVEGHTRDFVQDPYQPISTAVIAGNLFSTNKSAINSAGTAQMILDDNTFREQSNQVYGGDLRDLSPYLLQLAKTSAVIRPMACAPAASSPACNIGGWTNPATPEVLCTGMSVPKPDVSKGG